MGHISLPSLDDIVQEKDPRKQSEMLLNTVGILIKNLSELNGYLTSKNIRASSIEADRMNVNELSAISANLGTIEAGEVYGAYIATSHAYPRAELNNGNNLIGAYDSASNYVIVDPNSDVFTSARIRWHNSGLDALLYLTTAEMVLISPVGVYILASSGGSVELDGASVTVPTWSKFVNKATSQTLQAALDSKGPAFSGHTGAYSLMLGDGTTKSFYFTNGVLTNVV